MREPKYKGFSLETESWHYGFGGYKEKLLNGEEIAVLLTKTSSIPVAVSSFLQCAGQNLYEGDIVEGEERGEFGEVVSKWYGVVFWCVETCGFFIKDDIGENYSLDDFSYDSVVGNMYENPSMFQVFELYFSENIQSAEFVDIKESLSAL